MNRRKPFCGMEKGLSCRKPKSEDENVSKTKDRIRESNLRYKQNLGQNFIYDEDLLDALAEDAEVGPEDDVLEIGPGAGSLTKHLCSAWSWTSG